MERWKNLLLWIRRLVNWETLLAGILLIFLGVALTTLSYSSYIPKSPAWLADLTKGVGIGLVGASITSLVVSFFIVRFPKMFQQELDKFLETDVKESLEGLRSRVEEQTRQLVSISKSLVSLDQAGISRSYTHRDEAAEDMMQDLQDPKLSKIWIIGISLNDFTRHETKLHSVWQVIQDAIDLWGSEQAPQRNRLDIRVLIIDPHCFGAYLRSTGEDRESNLQRSMLFRDVQITAEQLLLLEEAAKNKTGLSFQFRFYQLPPQLFLLQTDKVSYIEPYYFWGSRDPIASMPAFRFISQHRSQIHHGMEEHFDLIWKMASISSQEFLEQHRVGTDKGMRQCGAMNVFSNPTEARKRILWHLENAQKRVYIQGISLHSYFDDDRYDLFVAIQNLIQRGVEVKMLLLDPGCEQAVYRAFREHHLQAGLPDIPTVEEYQRYLKDQQGRAQEPLFRQTIDSINKIWRILMPLAKEHGNLQVKLYCAAPACFMLLADDMVMVEQYQYGKIMLPGRSITRSPILGKEMPLVEYNKHVPAQESVNIPMPNLDGGPFASLQERNAFSLMESHFDFVFTHCARSLEESDILLTEARTGKREA